MNSLEFELAKLNSMMDAIDEVIYVADPQTYELLYLNRKSKGIFGDVVGRKCYRALQGRDAPCPFCSNEIIFGEYLDQTYEWEFQNETNRNWYRCMDRAIDWPDGRKVRFEIAVDITKQKDAEAEIRRKSQEIIELSTPVMQVWEGVVVAPLIGVLDSIRTMNFMERFLKNIAETQSPVALIDITGVPVVDTQTAQHLTEAITAASLLGTRVILTGVKPAIAQTLVHLAVDLRQFDSQATLAAGLRKALSYLQEEMPSVFNTEAGE